MKANACLFLLAAGLIFLTGSCKKEDETPGQNEVFVESMTFNPFTITVKKNTAVKWISKDDEDHTVTSDNGTSFDEDPLTPGETFSYTPTAAGTFNYHCDLHAGMNGVLIVTD